MSEHEHFSAGSQARRSEPGKPGSPQEQHRQSMLLRHLGAVVSTSASRTPAARTGTAPVADGDTRGASTTLRVREVMDVPVFGVRADLPFLELARPMARERITAVPVVDAEDRVMGIVSESDLLAGAAACPHRPKGAGTGDRSNSGRGARDERAADLMTAPAVTVSPDTPVTDAALTAARSRLKRMPVTDQGGHLVGIVDRGALLRALLRDDEKIRSEIESQVVTGAFHLPPGPGQGERHERRRRTARAHGPQTHPAPGGTHPRDRRRGGGLRPFERPVRPPQPRRPVAPRGPLARHRREP
ncbi:CBS domain-containing protein [Kitasatospora sp. NPDC093679]|uniref:CBS domain-containing protein n=1 Tax=Kitasatospora sp. NPDC093679 TaxID=3154983 RepID=UPI00344AD1E6